MKFKARWTRLGTYQQTFEAIIEADDLDDLDTKFNDGEYLRFLQTENHLKESDLVAGPTYEEVEAFEQIN